MMQIATAPDRSPAPAPTRQIQTNSSLQNPNPNPQGGTCTQISSGVSRECNVNATQVRESGQGEAAARRMAVANKRLGMIQIFIGAINSGLTKEKAARKAGASPVTFWRWIEQFEQSGFSGLIPRTDQCGRVSEAERLGLSADSDLVRQVQGLIADMDGKQSSALRLFAHRDECPDEMARVILESGRKSKHSIPPSIRKVTRVNRAVMLAHRGPKALRLGGMWTPRKVDILPGDIFCSDDTTPIWGWWVPWPKSKDYPFGVKMLQGQYLPVIDVASQAVISFTLIAREKGSYRASDVWSLFGKTFDSVGLPRLGQQLERGSWEANLIRGVSVETEKGEPTHDQRVGGLRQLPTNITDWHRRRYPDDKLPKSLQTWTSYLPKSKSVEGMFNRMQTLEGTLWGCLGRDQRRIPFEKTKKIFEACQRGSMDPREHFLGVVEISSRLKKMLDYLNNEPVEGEVFRGVPSQIWAEAVERRPLLSMPESMRWLYRRDWRSVKVTQGWARIRLKDEEDRPFSLFYTNPEVFAGIEGDQVLVYFNREDFEKPAQIVDAKTGQFLCEAQYADRVGSFLDEDESGHEIRKRWRNAVISLYSAVVKHSPSRQMPEEITARRKALQGSTATPGTIEFKPRSQPSRLVVEAEEEKHLEARASRLMHEEAL